MQKLKQEYITQMRNTLIYFLVHWLHLSITDVAEIFNVDKSTISRVMKRSTEDKKLTDRKLLKDLSRYFR